MTGFSPQRMGELESAMWRSYYEGRWASLAWHGLHIACGEYRYSWWDGMRTSAYAAVAALYFRKRTEDPRCLPLLERYYHIIRRGSGHDFDAQEAARLELRWWQERREHVLPQDYARTIAALTGQVYEKEASLMIEASERRALAMHYRDQRRQGKMTESDWVEVSRQLIAAYSTLKRVVSPGEISAEEIIAH